MPDALRVVQLTTLKRRRNGYENREMAIKLVAFEETINLTVDMYVCQHLPSTSS